MAYKHDGFWQCMDTLRDKLLLQQLWDTGSAPWNVWTSHDSSSGRDAVNLARH
jgi:glucose-1-phosphate cytidylyltransferase